MRTNVRRRCLVVDDDEATRRYLTDVVEKLGLASDAAADGVEAALKLDARPVSYEIVLLDLDLPKIPGESILHGLTTLRSRPAAIIVMSGSADRLSRIPGEEWGRLGVIAALPKPLDAQALRAALERALAGRPAGPRRARTVLIAGGGLWADALASVVARGGGTLLPAGSRDEALASITAHQPSAIVAGKPLTDPELLDFCGAARAASPGSTILVAVNRADAALRQQLLATGVARVCLVPSGSAELAVSMVRAAGLDTRAHARVPLSVDATIETREGLFAGNTLDISEGGLCLVVASPEPLSRGRATVEIALPGAPRPVVAEAEVVWSAGEPGAYRAGLRFATVPEPDRERIRSFVTRHPSRASFTC